MTTRYVGIGGNDGNTGLSWAQRKLTLNGVEDTPVVAGDVCYIGPGVYRELLTVDVSGGAGNVIAYIGDVTGENTDGVGGVVRITGSDNDQTATRADAITANGRDYRTFRGFRIDLTTTYGFDLTDCEDIVIEDCVFTHIATAAIFHTGTGQLRQTVQRCLFFLMPGVCISFITGVNDGDHVIDACVFWPGPSSRAVNSTNQGGVDIRNSFFFGCSRAVSATLGGLGAPVACTVRNSIFQDNTTAFRATILGEIVEDFNALFENVANRTNTNVGANSNIFPALVELPKLYAGANQISGVVLPREIGQLSEWSPLRSLTDDGAPPTVDLLALPFPVTNGKRSWGAIQFVDSERETGTVNAGSAALVLNDAGRLQIRVPVSNVSTTITVQVHRETNYAGTNPQLIVKQPGQADDTTTDAAAAAQFNELTTTLTPAALPGWVVVELVSNNTAAAGSYKTFFDDLTIAGSEVDLGEFENWITDREFWGEYAGAPGGGGAVAAPIFGQLIVR
ncbi:hypothetical protein LCGC14_0842290 [marine sediment metagenome]|uniref:Right handed beta helix domain-containing protein n=1 Tax=marine sediment metagenome TaxID=412755 RepID=A0A0F9PCQ5_9ZZZZ